jgi:chaperone modulatory protein CbpM
MAGQSEMAEASGVTVETLELWVEQRWLLPEATAAGPRFSERDAARARLIADLRHAMGVNDAGIDVILHLVDQMHGLRRALAELRGTRPGEMP